MAIRASAADMILTGGANEPLAHGGDLGAARRLFPGAPEPFIDLSTGINPNPYPLPRFSAGVYARLPDPAALEALATAAARAYGAPSGAYVAAAPGTQILLPLVAGLAPAKRAAVLAPGYPEHARAAALTGFSVQAVRDIDSCRDAALVIVANPNNPDGKLFGGTALLALAKDLRRRGGVLVVDEAFMDVGPPGASLAAELACGNVVVLRSFGKFFGLAGVRLGFALAAPSTAARLRVTLGPWAVSGPALAVGTKALADTAWVERTRRRLAGAAKRLDAVLAGASLDLIGGTSLFRLVRMPAARALFDHLGRAGIWTRAFPDNPGWLRFGLPANEREWRRLNAAMASFRDGGKAIVDAKPAAGRRVHRGGKHDDDRLR
jgi:cobalamin biosynthesis protein CobC